MLKSKYNWTDRRAAWLKLYKRIMELSMEDLTREATVRENNKCSVLHLSAGLLKLPLNAVDRLCEAVGVDAKDRHGYTVIMRASSSGEHAVVEYFARNKRADLSIVDSNGLNDFNLVGNRPNTLQESKDKTFSVLKDNGITSADIIKGFRSPLGCINDSFLRPKRLAQEKDCARFYIRAMTLFNIRS
jgi:hypothetical protein